MSSSSKRIGVALFSSVILLSVASIKFSVLDMLRGRSNSLLRLKPSDDSSFGEIITPMSPRFSQGLWKYKRTTRTGGESDTSCEFEIVNDLDEPVLLCWVTETGDLKHYRPLNDKSIKDKSVSNIHREYTYVHDHFVCIRNIDPLPANLRDVREECFVFSYTPLHPKIVHTITLSRSIKKKSFWLRGSVETTIATMVDVSYSPVESAGEIIDSSQKRYDCRQICGFRVHYEPGVFDDVSDFESTITADITQLSAMLPAQACDKLQADTAIYINKSLTYGTTKHPIIATGCCYHPRGGVDWLRNNGLAVCKEGCVEIFSASSYLRSRQHWGTGGVLVHEFSHVYHDKHCRDGYDCEDIRNVSVGCIISSSVCFSSLFHLTIQYVYACYRLILML